MDDSGINFNKESTEEATEMWECAAKTSRNIQPNEYECRPSVEACVKLARGR